MKKLIVYIAAIFGALYLLTALGYVVFFQEYETSWECLVKGFLWLYIGNRQQKIVDLAEELNELKRSKQYNGYHNPIKPTCF